MAGGNISRRGKDSFRLKFEGSRDSATGLRRTHYVTLKGVTRKQAQIELMRRLSEQDRGLDVEPSSITVAAYVNSWLDGARHLAETTKERYRELAQHQIEPFIGRTLMQKLRPSDLTSWHADLLKRGSYKGEPLSPRTVGHAHRLLRTVLAQAARDEVVGRNVAAITRVPAVKAEEIEILTPVQVEETVRKLAGDRLLPIVITALGTGLRRGELCALSWADLDLDHGTLRVKHSLEETTRGGLRLKPPKTKQGLRSMSLPASVVDTLRNHLKTELERRLRLGMGRPESDDPVFAWPDGSHWGPDYLSRTWTKAVNKHKLPSVGLHSLRHTHASALIRAKVDLLTISRRLGHSDPAFTLRVYGHLMDRNDEPAARAIDTILGGMMP